MQSVPQTVSETGASPTADLPGVLRAQTTGDRMREFEGLLVRELPRLRRMAMGWLRNREDAEDAVQDAVLLAFANIASFEGRALMSTWLMSIVINSVKMHLRKRKQKMVPIEECLADGARTVAEVVPETRPNPEQMYQRSELHELLTYSIGKLSSTQRTALQLFALQGLSLKETAQRLEVPLGTLKAQLARGRGQLRQGLQKMLGPRTGPCRLPRLTSRKGLRGQLALRPLSDFAGPTRREGRSPHDSQKKRAILTDICLAAMKTPVEGSPVPA